MILPLKISLRLVRWTFCVINALVAPKCFQCQLLFIRRLIYYQIWIQMFSELKERINIQNLEKIRKNQAVISRGSGSKRSDSFQQSSESDEEFSERLKAFKLLMNESDNQKPKRATYNSMKMQQMSKQLKQKHLLEEQMKIDKLMHEQQINYLRQKYDREKGVLESQIEKLNFAVKRQVKEDGIVAALRKDNRQLMDLHAQSQQAAESALLQNSALKKDVLKLRALVKRKEQNQACLQAQKHLESDSQKRLKEQVITLQRELVLQLQRKKQLEATVHKLRIQNDQLIRQFDRSKAEYEHQRTKIYERNRLQNCKIQQQIIQLKKRNQKLEQSFIEHLTQTSFNLQQTLKIVPEKSGKNTTMYLQQSPIRPQSRQRERTKSPAQEQDPQKGNSGQKCDCSRKMRRLHGKLQQANWKIVDLLREKCLYAYR